MSNFRIQKGLLNSVKVFFPANEKAVEIYDQMHSDQEIDCKHTFPRNPGNHRRFFAFLNIAFDCQDFFGSIHHFRKWLVGKAGHYAIIRTPKGGIIFDADSIAWDSLDEPEFCKVFSDCVQAFIDEFGNKISSDKLDEIVRF